MSLIFKKQKRSVFYFDKVQEVVGYAVFNGGEDKDVFIAKGDSLTNRYPWYSFKSSTGKLIDDSGIGNRSEVASRAILNI